MKTIHQFQKFITYNDALTMAGRCLKLSLRNPDTLLTSIVMPIMMMLLFVALFGNLIHIADTSYVNYIVPGVWLQCLGQCSAVTAIAVNRDLKSNIIHRFQTLPVKTASLLTGHVLAALVRNIFTSVIVLLAAMLLGFRPSTQPFNWGIIWLLVIGVILTFSWLAIIIGLLAHSAEGASGLFTFAIILPYLSSGFVPTQFMPRPLAIFSAYQPMTPIIDTLRAALSGNNLDTTTALIAGGWCIGLVILFYISSKKALNGVISV